MRQNLRYYLNLPAREWFRQTPRLLARSVYFVLPLWLAYEHYPHRWPFYALISAYVVAGASKLLLSKEGSWTKGRFLAKSTAGSMKQLQDFILRCENRESIKQIQTQILSIIADKLKELLYENRDDVFSACLMEADDATDRLNLTVFSRQGHDRRKISLPYGSVGAGSAHGSDSAIYIPDVRDLEYRAHFRGDAPYRCILSIPVSCDHKKLGVVNVDSTRPNHFSESRWLTDHLAPYVQLIGLTICIEANTKEDEDDGTETDLG